MKRLAIGVSLIVALVTGGFASAHGGTITAFSSTGVKFSGGTYSFDPWPCTSACSGGHWSGMNWSGFLYDTQVDGNAVFIQSKVDGYGWSATTYHTKDATSGKYLTRKTTAGADPAQTGRLHICRDRGALLPNNCADSAVLRR